MEKINFEEVINILLKYKEIINVIDYKNSEKTLIPINQMIKLLKPHKNMLLQNLESTTNITIDKKKKKKNKKITYEEIITLFEKNDLKNLERVKLNYTELNNSSKVMSYLENNKEESVIRSATLIDLNLLYFILTGDKRELKKKKTEVYNMLTGYIKANKIGEAFSKLL